MKNADIELIKKEISNFWDYYNSGNTLPIETKICRPNTHAFR